MKERIPLWVACLTALFLFSFNLDAQDKTEVSVRIIKDGKVVSDTTYQFKDDEDAQHALKLMEIMSGDMDHAHSGGSKAMVYVAEDGNKTTIKEIHGDSLVWITEKELDGENVKVIKKKIKTGEHPHGEHVVITKKTDGDSFDIYIDEDYEGSEDVKVIVVKTRKDKDCESDGEKEVQVEVKKEKKK